MENIRKTKPSWASASMLVTSCTKENGEDFGPKTTPAARKPTTTDKPIRWQIQPTTPATTSTTARSWMKLRPCMVALTTKTRRSAQRVKPPNQKRIRRHDDPDHASSL